MRPSLCIVVSSPMTVNAFLQEPLKRLAERYRIYAILNGSPQDMAAGIGSYLTVLPLAIERKISPLKDLAALWKMMRLFRKHQFDIIHSVTPKAGLLAMAAAYFAGTGVRIHTFTGQVWVTRNGMARWLLKGMDRIIALLATNILIDSPSQRQFLLDEKVVSRGKSRVLGKGSISGVDERRFKPSTDARRRIRHDLHIPDEAVVFLFLGRLNHDKGVLDLAAAFAGAAGSHTDMHLLVVGPDEEGLQHDMIRLTGEYADRMHFAGYADRPEDYMAAADVLCLPSYREGFGSVIIEAAAVGLPAIGSRIYGIVDAIDEGRTGLLHKAGNITELQSCMSTLAASKEHIADLGRKARERVLSDFTSEALATAWLAYYRTLS